MWTVQEYMSEVAREQVARPQVPVGRVHYEVLVRVAPAVAFSVTDSTPYNPCFHAERLDAFLALVGQRLPGADGC